MIYYGTRLSENISRRDPEGYLLCLNVPVARTGTQEYLPDEIGFPSANGRFPIPVYRPESEVFSPETIASFEGMPVTNDHPPGGVTIENIRALQKGHAHNVRRGTGEESDLLLADLIITDPVLIDAILGGKREISCGYTYELHEENGQYIQRKIRGNHVAVVDAGRAGNRVSIKDQKPKDSKPKQERRTVPMKKSLLKTLNRLAKDGDPDAIEGLTEAVEEIIENAEEEKVTVTVDADTLTAILERLDRLIALLSPAAAAGDDDPEEAPDAPTAATPAEELAEVVEEAVEAAGASEGMTAPGEAAEAIAATVEEILAEENAEPSGILEPEDAGDADDPDDRISVCTADALRVALKTVQPSLRKMSPKERRRVCTDIAERITRKLGNDSSRYAALIAARKPVRHDYADLGKRIMAKRNPNYHG